MNSFGRIGEEKSARRRRQRRGGGGGSERRERGEEMERVRVRVCCGGGLVRVGPAHLQLHVVWMRPSSILSEAVIVIRTHWVLPIWIGLWLYSFW